jgi:hypothetical protein
MKHGGEGNSGNEQPTEEKRFNWEICENGGVRRLQGFLFWGEKSN